MKQECLLILDKAVVHLADGAFWAWVGGPVLGGIWELFGKFGGEVNNRQVLREKVV